MQLQSELYVAKHVISPLHSNRWIIVFTAYHWLITWLHLEVTIIRYNLFFNAYYPAMYIKTSTDIVHELIAIYTEI